MPSSVASRAGSTRPRCASTRALIVSANGCSFSCPVSTVTFVRALGVGARRLEPPAQHLDPGEIEEDVRERVLVPVVEGRPVHLV